MTQAWQSPNYNERRQPLDMIVLHYTGMQSAQAALERLCDPAAQVSAHYLIDEDGQLFELVDPLHRAWHAGVSSWEGERDVNSRAIGIELVNPGHEFGYCDFPQAQIAQLLALLAHLACRYHIPRFAIWGHSDVAPERKLDPGEKFPWARLGRHGFGVWPSLFAPRFDGHPEALLEAIGYPTGDLAAAQAAFKRHFRPHTVGQGWTCADTRAAGRVLWALKRVGLGRWT
ncbi:MAG: N-acetylmuramoyl-L-alanine amidase [Pseudomonadota bacterium]